MKVFALFFSSIGFLLPVLSSADEPLPEIISEWHQATSDVTAVESSVVVVKYDDVFFTQKFGKGHIGYLSPQHGYIKFSNHTDDKLVKRSDRSGNPYELKPLHDEHIRWHADQMRIIDDERKFYVEFMPSCNLESGFLNLSFYRTMDQTLPFLPGCPNKDASSQWNYKLTKQNKERVWMKATPKPDSPFVKNFEFCELYFQRHPVRLLATRLTHPSFNSETVYLFSDVELNPEAWQEPDLSEYTQK